MDRNSSPTIVCLASYFKGNEFFRECKRLGARVALVTTEAKVDEAWARESLDDILTVTDRGAIENYIAAINEFARVQQPDAIVALEEADVITAGRLREHLCLPGLSGSQAMLFRDKLTMRHQAEKAGIAQPRFTHLLNYQEVGEFMERVPPPWVIKPRADASSIGIQRLDEPEQAWRAKDQLDGRQSVRERSAYYLLESFIPGDVYHVNSLVAEGKIVFANVSRYGRAPLEVTQRGGVSTSCTVKYHSADQKSLLRLNQHLLASFGITSGTTHAEFIKSAADGKFYFLEVAARVGGAYTAEAVEAATGINLWREWARIVMADAERPYRLPPVRKDHSGLAVSLARQEIPDTSQYTDQEIVYRARKPHHVALVVRSPELPRIEWLLKEYEHRFERDFTAVAPQPERPE